MTKDEGLKLALEALELEDMACRYEKDPTPEHIAKAITAIREALAQPEQKVDWEKLYRLEVKKKEALAAKYERDIKPLTKIVPMAQPEQEPVALETVYETIIQWDEGGGKRSRRELARRIVALYITPPQRTWQGLTEDEINEVLGGDIRDEPSGELEFVRAIEAKLKEKNHDTH